MAHGSNHDELAGAAILRPGQQLNGVYEIDALLARGGMGEVYRGHAIQTGDPVAIKVIRADLAENELALALFRSEASKLHRLHHEAIIRYFLFSVDPAVGRAYLAMEFVEGEPLSQALRRGPLPPAEVRRLAIRLAGGLGAAHRRDIVHRDVSPDNVILQRGDVDEAKIIDFGIARSTEAGTTLIDVGFAGKLNYVSPEQVGLYGGEVGPRSDIYSLGLVLAEALRGEALDMGGTQVEMIEKRQRLPDLSGVDARLRPALDAMLRPDPADRLQTMEAAAEAFAAALPAARRAAGAPSSARARGAVVALAALAGAAALAPLGIGVFMLLAPAPAPRAVPDAALTEAAPAPAPAGGTQDAPPEPGRPETQKPPAAHEDPLAYVARYDGGPCFAILSATASAGSARIEAVGALREAFETLNEAFRNAFGFEAEIKAALATRAQCAAIDFFRAAADGRDFAPKIELASAFPHAGAPLTGSVTSPAGRALAAVFVDPAGLAQGAETPPASGRGRAFSLTPPRAKESAELQLLLLVSSAAPLAALRPGRPAPAEAMLSAARAEAEARGDRLGVGLAYFYVTD